MKTILFLIAVLLFPLTAQAQVPNVALKLSITNGAKVFTTAHVATDSTIPTGAGDLAWTGYLLEDLDAPLDTNLDVRLGLVSHISPETIWPTRISKYVVIFDYRGLTVGHSVLGSQGLTVTDLSGLGLCSVTPVLEDGTPTLEEGFIRVESCEGTSGTTGDLMEMTHTPVLDNLVNDGRRQLNVVLVQVIDKITGNDLLNGLGCDTIIGGCSPQFGLSLSFTLTHYGRSIGNGPKMKADSAAMEGLLGLTCEHGREIACTDETGGVSCRQPHICNTSGDVDGDNLVGTSDVLTVGDHVIFNSPFDVGPDDNKFSPFDPNP